MIICGLKLTHDSSISVIDNDELIFCIELEKIANNNRFKIIDRLEDVATILQDNGYPIHRIDKIVIDGWVGTIPSNITLSNGDDKVNIKVAPYHEMNKDDDIFKKYEFSDLIIGDKHLSYESYTHVSGHILSAYATSPFAIDQKTSYILVWDGGMYPRLYFYEPSKKNQIKYCGCLFYLGVNCYSIFAQHFGPFKINSNVIKDELSIAGKVMAYCAFGSTNKNILNDLEEVYIDTLDKAKDLTFLSNYPYLFAKKFIEKTYNKLYSDEDILMTFHFFIQNKLLEGLEKYIDKRKKDNFLCYSGGAALNIKWNSAIRNSTLFKNIWIPPFPNDSGSSIGATISGLNLSHPKKIKWSVYSGPNIILNKIPKGWIREKADISIIASILNNDEPILALHSKAEIGPRALGNRSILASPTSKKMKDRLNEIKFREFYRPVAPVCLEEKAYEIFNPGTPDPFMLYEHTVVDKWRSKIPAVVHLDNTARLQTVNPQSNALLYNLLKSFEKLSGIPVLCNTSANLKGRGFFPDIYTAAKWGKIDYIWCNNYFYRKEKLP